MNNKTEIELKYRTWWKGVQPRPIKLQIPGWAGDGMGHSDGDKPQPWHCPPFVEGSTYGLELVYPFDAECRVSNVDGKVVFDAEWEPFPEGVKSPPFLSFAPGHYGFTSSLDIQCPEGYIVRLEPHPRFYTDTTGTVPLAVVGHIQADWWPRIFFVVFRSPRPGETHVFRHGEPYASILILPRRVSYTVSEMSVNEMSARAARDLRIAQHGKSLAKNRWVDHVGNPFDDKYRVLSGIYAREGLEGVDRHLEGKDRDSLVERQRKSHSASGRLPRKLIIGKNEKLPDKEE